MCSKKSEINFRTTKTTLNQIWEPNANILYMAVDQYVLEIPLLNMIKGAQHNLYINRKHK